jgi:hypothetical protein
MNDILVPPVVQPGLRNSANRLLPNNRTYINNLCSGFSDKPVRMKIQTDSR